MNRYLMQVHVSDPRIGVREKLECLLSISAETEEEAKMVAKKVFPKGCEPHTASIYGAGQDTQTAGG